jgi:hypothetical protein
MDQTGAHLAVLLNSKVHVYSLNQVEANARETLLLKREEELIAVKILLGLDNHCYCLLVSDTGVKVVRLNFVKSRAGKDVVLPIEERIN